MKNNSTEDWQRITNEFLKFNVPRFIAHIKARGGVAQEEWEWLTSPKERPSYPEYIINRADEYILFPKSMEDLKQGMSVLILALAIMSFIPGGVRFAGLHYDSNISGHVEND